jgi:hypothetical protein
MELLKMIKDLQAVLMAGNELPHLVSVRLLARLDEAERHLPQPKAAEVTKEEPAVEAVKEVEGLEEVK